MNTLIAYSTKHGATRRYAEELAGRLNGPVTVVDLRKEPGVDVSPFEQVVIGSCIYAGRVPKEAHDFCTRNLDALRQKRLGLFACGWQEGEGAKQQLWAAFPAELLSSAAVADSLGGDMNLEAMNFLERFAARVIAKVKESASHYSEELVSRFAESLEQASAGRQ